MNINFNDLANRLNIILCILLFTKTCFLILNIFLPENGYNLSLKNSNLNFYDNYRISKKLNIKEEKLVINKKNENTYNINNLNLNAIYMDDKKNFIIILDKNTNKNHFLSLNEEYEGYKLIEILKKEVVFFKNSKRYLLKMEKDQSNLLKKIEIKPSNQKTTQTQLKTITKNELLKYTSNLDNIFAEIDIEPVYKKNKLEGFLVNWVEDKGIFNKLGIQKGDIIIAFNDTALKSEADAFNAYENITKLTAVKLTILRNSVKKDLEYEIK